MAVIGKPKGVFCLEIGEWSGDLKTQQSVEPLLLLLKHVYDVPYIHRDVSTKSELLFYLRKWPQKTYRDYPILYLAFHGVTGAILAAKVNGRTEEFSMAELVEALRGRCHRRIIHFGACNVLNLHGNSIQKFLLDTDALAVCGYAKDIDWVRSSALDLLLLAAAWRDPLDAERRLPRIHQG